jgi:hypothetical protein
MLSPLDLNCAENSLLTALILLSLWFYGLLVLVGYLANARMCSTELGKASRKMLGFTFMTKQESRLVRQECDISRLYKSVWRQ